MQIRVLILLFAIVFSVACSGGKTEGSGTKAAKLHDTVWVDLLTQLYINEAFKNKRGVAGKDITKEVLWLDSIILSEHNLTREEFTLAYTELGKDIKRIDKIFDQVLESLSKMESELKSDTLKSYSLPYRPK